MSALQSRAEDVLAFFAYIGADQPAGVMRELIALIPPEQVVTQGEELWGYPSAPVARPSIDRTWCGQCDRRVDPREQAICRSQFCKAKIAA